MDIPAQCRHEACGLENLRIVSQFKSGAQLYLISAFQLDAIVCHCCASVERRHIKGDAAEHAGCAAAGIDFISFHQELLAEALIVCPIGCRSGSVGVAGCAITHHKCAIACFYDIDCKRIGIIIQGVFITGHFHATIDLSGSYLGRRPRDSDFSHFEMIDEDSRHSCQDSAIHFHELHGIVAHGIRTDIHHTDGEV